MKTKAFLTSCLLAAATIINAQKFEWARSFGGTSEDFGISMNIDESGNVYTTGYFDGTVDFNPGSGTSNLTSAGGNDIFVQKMDASGNFLWARSFGGTSDDRGHSIIIDVKGDIFTTGIFSGTADFDPGTSTTNKTSVGGRDIFVQKMDASGNFLWVKSFGGTSNDQSNFSEYASGNIYTTGYFSGDVDFDPGTGTTNLSSLGNRDIFVQKMDTAGKFLWARSFGGSDDEFGNSINLDTSGNVYTTGDFQGTADFDPGAGTTNLTSTGSADIFVQKMDASGKFLWARAFGATSSSDIGQSISSDGAGNVYATGYFQGSMDFDPGTGTSYLSSTGSWDIFVQKMDASGKFLWAKSFGGTGDDRGYSIAVDRSGNAYTMGYYYGSVDFDPGTGTNNLTSAGLYDIFVQKMDASGKFLWAKSFGGTSYQYARSIRVDTSGNIYTAGYFQGTADFDPGTGTNNLSSAGGMDIFVQKMSKCINSTKTDVIKACDSYKWIDGKTYFATKKTATHILKNSIGCDSIVTLDLTINYSKTTTDTIKACNSYNWIDGKTYTTSNTTAEYTYKTTKGCDSVVTLNLTINTSNTGIDVIKACNSYKWIDGNTYTASNNTATRTLNNATGCDSVITLNLTINSSNTGIDIITACDSHKWIDGKTYTTSNNTIKHTLTNVTGCDSLVMLNLTINTSNTGTDVITACNSYKWMDGKTYTASNTAAKHTLTNSKGCDSVITLNLTINSVSDITTTLSDVTITAKNSKATYQWLDCNKNYSVISGKTSQLFTATTNGNYAVKLTENGCVDTSACVSITTIGIDRLGNSINVSIYPNPTTGVLLVTFQQATNNVELVLTDIQGKVIYKQTYVTLSQAGIELNGARGIYFLTIKTPEGQSSIKLVKE